MLNAITLLEQLKQPFEPKFIHWRPGSTNRDKTKGLALAYLDARAVMNRLDEVCGVYWQCRYPFEGCCEIGIKIGDEWVWRSNGAGETDIEGEKGQYSDSFKRAAVMWSIGKYLYYLPAIWVDLDERKRIKTPPELPKWALPSTGD